MTLLKKNTNFFIRLKGKKKLDYKNYQNCKQSNLQTKLLQITRESGKKIKIYKNNFNGKQLRKINDLSEYSSNAEEF